MQRFGKTQLLGWIAVGLSIIITCFWAFWGIIENFHEDWYYGVWSKKPVHTASAGQTYRLPLVE